MRKSKIILYTLGLLLVFIFFSNPANAEILPDAKDLLKKVETRHKTLDSFIADLKITVNFMGLKIPLDGKLLYKKPNFVKLIIPGIPHLLKDRKNTIVEGIPSSFAAGDYNCKTDNCEMLQESVECYVINLKPKKDPKIDCVTLWVDKKSYTSPKIRIAYSDKGEVVTLQSFQKIKNHILPAHQLINFNLKDFRAESLVVFKSFELNADVDEYLKENKE